MKSSETLASELPNCFMLTSTVSTRMPATMARLEGFKFEETLTGFKWMGNRASQLMESGHKVTTYTTTTIFYNYISNYYGIHV